LWQRRTRESELAGLPVDRVMVTASQPPSVEDAYLRVVELFARERGITELQIREPGFDRPDAEALTDEDVAQRLAGVVGHLPNGLYDGAVLPMWAALELLRGMLQGNGMWCGLEADERFVVCLDSDLVVRIGCDLPLPGAVTEASQLGLTVVPSDDPLALVERYPIRAADDAYWAEVAAAAEMCGSAIPFMESNALNVEGWHLVDSSNLDAVRAQLRPRSLVRAYTQPLLPATEANRALMAELAYDLMDFFPVKDGVCASQPAMCLALDGETGRLHGDLTSDEDELDIWISTMGIASAIGVYGHVDLPDSPEGVLTAALPDADGVVRARWI